MHRKFDIGAYILYVYIQFSTVSTEKGDVTVTLSDEDFIKMGSGQVNPQQVNDYNIM